MRQLVGKSVFRNKVLQKCGKYDKIRSHIRKLTKKNKQRNAKNIKDKFGNNIIENEEILTRWRKYISELYKGT